jgi:hypothetical protein
LRRLVLAAVLVAACNPYDPDLGDKPFLCGTDPPRCPDGYTAVDLTFTRCECQRNATAGDAAVYLCDGDPNEPNETPSKPTETKIDGLNTVYNSDKTSICPGSDVDVYKLLAPVGGTLITVDVAFDTMRQPPEVDILDRDGASLGPGHDTHAVGHVVATTTAPANSGPFYAQVKGTGQEVNYTVRITILPPR